jgi:hypothetical protein
MQNPDNIWQRLWRGAVPLCASKQEQMFDPEKAAERALHDIETLPMADV